MYLHYTSSISLMRSLQGSGVLEHSHFPSSLFETQISTDRPSRITWEPKPAIPRCTQWRLDSQVIRMSAVSAACLSSCELGDLVTPARYRTNSCTMCSRLSLIRARKIPDTGLYKVFYRYRTVPSLFLCLKKWKI